MSVIQTVAASVAAMALMACSKPDHAIWEKEDPAVMAAMKAATRSLPIFLAKLESGEPGMDAALVKVGYPTRHGGIEYLWIGLETRDGSILRGQMVNEPEDVVGVHAGDEVSVERSKIADWSYRKYGKFYGQFTTRALLDKLDAKSRQEQLEDLAPTPLEPTTH